jgi:sporulation protein YabP
MEERQTMAVTHRLSLNGRKKALVTGVKDVLSFDANEVLLETEMGILMLRGDELHVNRLSLEKGEVDIEGRVDSMIYSDAGAPGGKEGSFFARMFR